VLFVGDPFAKDEYFLLFLTRLLYRDMSITVERAPLGQASRIGHDHYDAVFTFQHGRLMDATGPCDAQSLLELPQRMPTAKRGYPLTLSYTRTPASQR
jgi:hypothetical protein